MLHDVSFADHAVGTGRPKAILHSTHARPDIRQECNLIATQMICSGSKKQHLKTHENPLAHCFDIVSDRIPSILALALQVVRERRAALLLTRAGESAPERGYKSVSRVRRSPGLLKHLETH